MTALLADTGPSEVNFGAEPAFTIGVEEELLVVDADHRLADRGPAAVRAAEPDRGEVGGELFEAMVEARSDPSPTVKAAVQTLREVRRELLSSGTRIIGAGAHPAAPSGQSEVHQTKRYAFIEDSLQGILRTPICGQHIHIGMPDPESAIRAYNGIRTHVPLLNALAANSPFWFGEDSGLASARTVLFRSYPRAAMAPEFADFDDFRRITGQVVVAGQLDDYTQIWWDVRLHPMLGTIEIRAADSQFDLRRAAGLAAIVQCLTRIEAERDQRGIPAREALAESSFQATRHGLDAKLLDRQGQLRPARELARSCLDAAATVAADLGCAEELAEIEAIIADGPGADLQRRVHAREGMEGLLAYLAAETARLDLEQRPGVY